MMFDSLDKLADSKNKIAVAVLNIVCGIALLCAATWFSYNLFSTRDAAQSAAQTTVVHGKEIENNAKEIQALEKKVPIHKGQ